MQVGLVSASHRPGEFKATFRYYSFGTRRCNPTLRTRVPRRLTDSPSIRQGTGVWAWAEPEALLFVQNAEWKCVCWSVHRGRARACAHARARVCAAQGLPNEPARAGNGPPVPEPCNHRTLASRHAREAEGTRHGGRFVHAFKTAQCVGIPSETPPKPIIRRVIDVFIQLLQERWHGTR